MLRSFWDADVNRQGRGAAPPRDPGMVVLRITLAVLLAIHGAARVGLGIVDDFGVALSSWGFPLGHLLAWTITLVELAGGLLLALGRLTIPLAAWFAIQLAFGIALVHAPNGWFVVGAGRNGVEYSVCLIAGLGAVIVSEFARRRRLRAP